MLLPQVPLRPSKYSFIRLISVMMDRPSMYVGKRDIDLLQIFMSGWQMNMPSAENALWQKFYQWSVKKILGRKRFSGLHHSPALGWGDLFKRYCKPKKEEDRNGEAITFMRGLWYEFLDQVKPLLPPSEEEIEEEIELQKQKNPYGCRNIFDDFEPSMEQPVKKRRARKTIPGPVSRL